MGPARPRLAYVVHSLDPGGTERLVVQMAKAFAVEFDVAVFCLDQPGAWADSLREAGLPVYALYRQPGLDLSVAFRLAMGLRQFGADIVHAHQYSAWFYSALARLRYPAPRLLFQEHGRFHPEVDRLRRRLVNRLLISRLTHRVVAVSEDIRARLVCYEGLDARRVQVIYNGVMPVSPLQPAVRLRLREQLGLRADDFVVGTVGRFDPIKNLSMLVSAVAEGARASPRLCAMLIGDGPQRGAIEAQIAEVGLEARVRLPGYREDARELVQCLDLFVLSSFSEGTSVALLEAIAAGVPVAVTAVGGNPEIVVAGTTGWVVPSGDVAALSRVFGQALDDPASALAFAQAGRTRFVQRFTFAGMIDAYHALYSTLLESAPRLAHGAGT